jgi:hypothetical protein
MIEIEHLIELAQMVESEDNIDWDMLSISEDNAYNLIAMSVKEQYETEWVKMSNQTREMAMLAVITKLLVENFVERIKHN